MPQFSENQRALIQMGSMFLLYIAAAPASIVPDSPYAPAIRTALGLAAVAGMGLQKILQASPEEQSAILDLVQKYLAMPPEKQQELIAYLPKILPLLQAVSTQAPPQPPPLP